MSMKEETIYGQIIAKANNYQAVPVGKGGRRIIKTDNIRAYERSIIQQCRIYRDKAINSDFTLFVKVYHSNGRYDLDNSLKTLLDCLQQVRAITDDKYCTKIVAEKHIDRMRPRVTFALQPLQYSFDLFLK